MSTSKSNQKLSDRYSSGANNTGSSNKKFVSKPIIITVMAVVIIAVIVVIIALLGGGGKESNDASSYNLVTTPDGDTSATQTDTNTVPDSYDVSMNSEWRFINARAASENAYVANIASNTTTVNIVVKRNDTGAVIYESPDIPIGGELTNIKLDDETLQKGSYPCTVTYYLLGKDRTRLSHVNVSIDVIIEND